MKRKALLIMAASMFVLAACGKQEPSVTPSESTSTSSESSSQSESDSTASSSKESESTIPSSTVSDIEQVRADAISSLRNYIRSLSADNYSADDYAAIQAMLSQFETEVASCQTESEVRDLLRTYRNDIAAIETFDYAALKAELKSEIEAYPGGIDDEEVLAVVATAKAEIDASPNDKTALRNIVDQAKADIDEIIASMEIDYEALRTRLLAQLDEYVAGETDPEVIAIIDQAKADLNAAEDDVSLLNGIVRDAIDAAERYKKSAPQAMSIVNIECYNENWIKVETNDFSMDDVYMDGEIADVSKVTEIAFSNGGTGTLNPDAPLYQAGAGVGFTIQNISGSTVNCDFTLHFKIELKDGSVYAANLEVSDGQLVTLALLIQKARASLTTYLEDHLIYASDYDDENWAAINDLLALADADLEEATSKSEIQAILAKLDEDIAAIEKKPIDYAALRTSLKEEIDAYVYGDASEAVLARASQAKTALDEADDDVDVLRGIVAQAKADIDAIRKEEAGPEEMVITSLSAYAPNFMSLNTSSFKVAPQTIRKVSASGGRSATYNRGFPFGTTEFQMHFQVEGNGGTSGTFDFYFEAVTSEGDVYACNITISDGSIVTLAQIKTSATNTVNNYFGAHGIVEDKYTEEDWASLLTIKANALTAIENATSVSAVNAILSQFEADVEAVPLKPVEDWEAYKTALKAEIDAYLQEGDSDAVLAIALAAKANIDAGEEDKDVLDGIVAQAKADIDAQRRDDAGELPMHVTQINCYNNMYIKIWTDSFTNSQIKTITDVVFSNGTSGGHVMEHYTDGGRNETVICVYDNSATTVGTSFNLTLKVTLTDGTVYALDLNVSNGSIVS